MNLGNKGKSRWLYGSSIFVLLVFIFIFTEVIRTPSSTLIKTPISSASPNPPTSISPSLAPTASANLSATVKPNSTPTPTNSSANTHSTIAQFPSHKTTAAPKLRGIVVPKGRTVTTKTASGSQTITVNTNKVTVTITPTIAGNPTASPTATPSLYPAYAGTIIKTAPDWAGFIAPKVSFAGVLSCKKSTILMQNWISGKWEYPYLVTEHWKFTNGNFIIGDDSTHYTPADTYYRTFTDKVLFTNNMNVTIVTPEDFLFHPLNWEGVHSSWAADTADIIRDISYDIQSTYTQSECQ